VQIADWKHNPAKGYWSILINRADKAESDVAFRDFPTKAVRKGGKTKSEGVEFSAHIIIKPEPGQPKGLVLITMGAGVRADMVDTMMTMLTRLLGLSGRSPSIFKFPHPNGTRQTYKVRYQFKCLAHKSALLDEALQKGEFVSLELIAPEVSAFDTGGNLVVQRRAVSVRAVVPKGVTGASIKNGISYFMGQNPSQSFDKARIFYKNDIGKEQHITLATNDLDAAFTKKHTIEFTTEVEQQQVALSSTVITEMEKLL